MVEIVYTDPHVIVCVKPARVLSTDEPGGLPELLRSQLGTEFRDLRTVHRLDRVVSGLMVLARTPQAASELSRQVREGELCKVYLAVLHGIPVSPAGELRDLLGRDKARKMTYVARTPGKDVREARLSYAVLGTHTDRSLVRIRLHTGRTHQIRVQFSSRGLPLLGERKYAVSEDTCELALYSHQLGFCHPVTGTWMEFSHNPPQSEPWTPFRESLQMLPKEGENTTDAKL